MNGKLIVIEGLDGSGKSTQFSLLYDYLNRAGQAFRKVKFPDYESDSSMAVRMYLNGDIGRNPAQINAYAASSFYAVDRYISFKNIWGEYYLAGGNVITDRYTTSNPIYQMTKLPKDNWHGYLNWLWDYEYEKLKLPQPDLVIYLDMDPEISKKLLSKRYKGDESKRDIHESNDSYLKSCRKAGLYTAEMCKWEKITCFNDGEPLSVEEIHGRILGVVKQRLGM